MAANDPYTRHWITVKRGEHTTEIPPRSLKAFRDRGWQPVTESPAEATPDTASETTPEAGGETPPGSPRAVARLRRRASQADPDHAEAIAAMEPAELREQYGD